MIVDHFFPASPGWTILGLSPIVIYFLTRYLGVFLLETIVDYALSTFKACKVSGSRPLPGPKWQIPNGQIIDKFINGRVRSEQWSNMYGSVYQIWAGPHPEVVITTPEQIRQFHSDGDKHGKPRYSNLGWYLGQVLGSCIGLLEGDDWKSKKKIFEPPFTHSASRARVDITDRYARKFVENLPLTSTVTVDSKSPDKFSFPIVPGFQKYAFIAVATVIYGTMTDKEENELWDLAEKRLALSPYLILGGPYRYQLGRWLDRQAFELLDTFTREWREFNEHIVLKCRTQEVKAPIVSYWNAYELGDVTEKNLMHTLDEMLMTNLDVTTHVVTWLITLVADNRAVKQELLNEIDANLDKLDEYFLRSDSTLHRCFQESLRLRPPLMFSAGESSPSLKNLDGFLIKPNTMVLVDVLAINVRNPFWGENSEKFDPSRFKDIKPSDLRYNLVMFGFGGRKCPGQYFGAQLAKILLVRLLQQYDIRVVKGRMGQTGYKTDDSNWVPMADVTVQLEQRELN